MHIESAIQFKENDPYKRFRTKYYQIKYATQKYERRPRQTWYRIIGNIIKGREKKT